jgi:glycosyltransferase involved in cell wall biosynthesis
MVNEGKIPENLKIEYIQATRFTRFIHDLHSMPGLWFLFYEAYRRWQKQTLAAAVRLHKEERFDIVHHVNIIGFREPGYLWQLGIPFFWGPISGAPMVPLGYLKDFGLRERVRWGTRNLLNRMQFKLARRPTRAAKTASLVWTVSREDSEVIKGWSVNSEHMLETGCSIISKPCERSQNPGINLRICWSGLFQGIKALPLLLRALANTLPLANCRLEILGCGPEEKRWKQMANDLALGDRIVWHGMIPRDKALAMMNDCDVLVHTSVKEGTPHVVLEALGMGIPVICHDACGMGIAVDSRCGLKIPLADPATSVEGFRAALLRLIEEPRLLETLSGGALARAAELDWDTKVNRFLAAYSEALGS